ncbi:MAG TPA: ATP12 family protein [Stellaceae bacterium]|nr:ATP12 family protein [Stellaceae bacterium]
MKRFYAAVAAHPAERGFGVSLDGKPLRTPAKAVLVVPTRALAEAIAAEWRDQSGEVKLDALPLTRLASTALDLVAQRQPAVVAEIARYAGTDLVCYRAEHPPELIERQHVLWQPLLDWATLRYDAPLLVTAGVLPVVQPPESLAAYAAAVAAYAPLELAALHLATAVCGSLVVALALIEGRLDTDAAFAAAELDQSFEIERWGEDAEQTQRRAALKEDIALAERFIGLLRS